VPLLNPVAKALRVAQMRLLEGGFDDKVQDALAVIPFPCPCCTKQLGKLTVFTLALYDLLGRGVQEAQEGAKEETAPGRAGGEEAKCVTCLD